MQNAVAPKRAPIRLNLTTPSSIISVREGRRGTRMWAGILGRVAALAILAVTYGVAGKLGLRLAFVHASATAVWPPTGIALAALLVRGYRVWPSILLGAFLVNMTTAGSVGTSIGIAMGNTLEALLGAYLVKRFAHGLRTLDRAQDVFKFTLLAGVVSTTVSATFGVTSLTLGGFATSHTYASIWLTWWLGDAAGALIVTPVLLLWSADRRVRWPRGHVLETLFFVPCLVIVGQAVFGGWLPTDVHDYPLEFVCIPPLVWAAFRFGQREAATASVALSALALWGTLRGFGPFVRDTQNESLLLLQAFMATVAVTTMAICAVVTERRRAEVQRTALIDNIKTLRGLLRICSCCNKICNEADAWVRLEAYIEQHSEAAFSHGLCPECVKQQYANLHSGLVARRADRFG
jgi:integral membrane sensor domain MASE1